MREYMNAVPVPPGWMLALLSGIAVGRGVRAAAADRHGLSAFGELKYPADFKHFE